MRLKTLMAICFAVCILCIIAGVVIAFVLIWGNADDKFIWKSLVSTGVLFMASALTLSISKMMESRGGK
jgi:hypothetical protein